MQMITALKQAHFYGICHGDIKCENVMVTSWRWVYLTDFATYKPTYIPADDPAGEPLSTLRYFYDLAV